MTAMEQGSSIPRPSGIPRFSKLPVPKSPALRASQSRETLSTAGEVRNPRLRPVASRDQLASSAISRPPPNPRESIRAPAQNKLSLRQPAAVLGKSNSSRTPPSKVAPVNSRLSRRKETAPPAQAWITSDGLVEEENATAEAIQPEVQDDIVEEQAPQESAKPLSYKPRPSLSDRTIETLSMLPSSPAVTGRSNSFYDPESARKLRSQPSSRPVSRPGSSHHSDGSNRPASRGSRPGSSSGQDATPSNFRASTSFNTLSTIEGTPSKTPSSIKALRTPASRITPVRNAKIGTPASSRIATASARSRSPSPERTAQQPKRFGSKTISARTPKAKSSVNGLFKKPSMPTLPKTRAEDPSRKTSLTSQRSSNTSAEDTVASRTSTTSTALTTDSGESPKALASRKSSAALREQIARAKAAKRDAASRQVSSQTATTPLDEVAVIPTDTSFDFGLSSDPFNQQSDEKSRLKMLKGRIETARSSGRLNIAAMSLKELPMEVLQMYDPESMDTYDSSWAESVDLSRFVAADNELEMLDESFFPDVSPEEFENDPDSRGNIFGGLETLDLHGNMLISLPMGLRRLPLLTSLNLSGNRLANNCFEVISQITALRDLKLGGNLLYGPLEPSLAKLENLEILDLHGNNISSLPLNIDRLTRLRILNISENAIEVLPFSTLASLPLTDIVARKNQLSGTLIEEGVDALPHLQVLDVSANQLSELVSPEAALQLPKLHQLSLSMNRLQSLPDIRSWISLVTLTADENNINAIPEGMTELKSLRSADFSSNDIRVVPAEVGRMENLAMLRLSGNPLRDKKFINIDTDELKEILKGRLEPLPLPEEVTAEEIASSQPVEAFLANGGSDHQPGNNSTNRPEAEEKDNESDADADDFATPPTSAPASPNRSRAHTLNGQAWSVKPGGILDRSNTESSSLHPVMCAKLASEEPVREVLLHHNLFTALPESLSFFAETITSLSLSHNQLVGETYLGTLQLSFPVLTALNLASNHITSLTPLTANLTAPSLQKLDVSFNRISALPSSPLQTCFPSLSVLLISNNHLPDLPPDTIKGLKIVDAANNDIAHLNPRIGLLGGQGGLERLDVMGNRFRVPRWNVLERGTEATLRWLRGRVGVAEMRDWNRKEGEEEDGEEDGEGEGEGHEEGGDEAEAETSLADLD
jgi:Leucine-rich repeat (LRR) protein